MFFKSGLNYFRAILRPACSYEPGLPGSSLEWDELLLCSYDYFYSTSVGRHDVNIASLKYLLLYKLLNKLHHVLQL